MILYWNLYFFKHPQKLRFFIFFYRYSCSMLPWENKLNVKFLFMVLIARFSGRYTHSFESKNSGISRVDYWMINRKYNYENKVNNWKLAVLKKSIFW